MATFVRSYSKINLGLAIGAVRPDGFHGLATLYQTLALHDVVTVEVKPGSRYEMRGSREDGQLVPGAKALVGTEAVMPGLKSRPISETAVRGRVSRAISETISPTTTITLTTNHAEVPTDARNTAWKMVERALSRMGVAADVTIHIEKNLPVQGGLGAGSANAAAALIGLERELGVTLPVAERLEIAAEVGSDVPLFLLGGAVMGTGRGEIVSAMNDLPATWCVVAVPEVGVSTPQAFKDWDELYVSMTVVDPTSQHRDVGHPAAGLTSPVRPDRLEELSHVYASVVGASSFSGASHQPGQTPDPSGIVRGSAESDTRNDLAENTLLALVRTGIENDFESVVFPQYPPLREIKRLLMGTPAGVSLGDISETRPGHSSGTAIYAALSGSGSTLFGLYRTEAEANAAQQRVQATGCKAIGTKTLPREEYWRRMFAE
jgi:4-diphosphocytidyl-2-C-methyl-D-erythritol kinase